MGRSARARWPAWTPDHCGARDDYGLPDRPGDLDGPRRRTQQPIEDRVRSSQGPVRGGERGYARRLRADHNGCVSILTSTNHIQRMESESLKQANGIFLQTLSERAKEFW